jgi:thiamine biosynthesis lipoprotein
MTLTRRRFLVTASLAGLAAAVGYAAPAPEVIWRGRVFGAEASIRLRSDAPERARSAIRAALGEIARVERAASLYRRDSELVRLNRTGVIVNPSTTLSGLLALCDALHAATEGAFDPSVQPLFTALAGGGDAARALGRVGWQRVSLTGREVRLGRGMALTLNGIAQGWAADRVAEALAARGFDEVMIDTGELRALGGGAGRGAGWPVQLQGRTLQLADRALATSEPLGTVLDRAGRIGHILDPRQGAVLPRWRKLAVSAPDAAVADGLSTALCLLDEEAQARALRHFPAARIEARLPA